MLSWLHSSAYHSSRWPWAAVGLMLGMNASPLTTQVQLSRPAVEPAPGICSPADWGRAPCTPTTSAKLDLSFTGRTVESALGQMRGVLEAPRQGAGHNTDGMTWVLEIEDENGQPRAVGFVVSHQRLEQFEKSGTALPGSDRLASDCVRISTEGGSLHAWAMLFTFETRLRRFSFVIAEKNVDILALGAGGRASPVPRRIRRNEFLADLLTEDHRLEVLVHEYRRERCGGAVRLVTANDEEAAGNREKLLLGVEHLRGAAFDFGAVPAAASGLSTASAAPRSQN